MQLMSRKVIVVRDQPIVGVIVRSEYRSLLLDLHNSQPLQWWLTRERLVGYRVQFSLIRLLFFRQSNFDIFNRLFNGLLFMGELFFCFKSKGTLCRRNLGGRCTGVRILFSSDADWICAGGSLRRESRVKVFALLKYCDFSRRLAHKPWTTKIINAIMPKIIKIVFKSIIHSSSLLKG